MSANMLITYVVVSLSIILIWYLYFWLHKDYAIDLFRQRVFVLRDRLFDEAANGLIEFKHPAYCVLRRSMNGYIRFSHKATILNGALHGLLLDKNAIENDPYSFEHQFNSAIQNLDNDTVKKLKDYKRELRLLLAKHLVIESPILIFFIIISLISLVIPIIFLLFCYERITKFAKTILLNKLKYMESEAFAMGKL